MPLYIDPAWEYFVPSKEMLEVQEEDSRDFDSIFDLRSHCRGENPGFSFERRRPNSCVFRFGKAKTGDTRILERKECPVCGWSFQPKRRARKTCSRGCARFLDWRGRPCGEALPERTTCRSCLRKFEPHWNDQTTCSRGCAGKLGGPKVRIDDNRFRILWLQGVSREGIAQELGMTINGVKKARIRLKLPARPSGNHSGKPRRK